MATTDRLEIAGTIKLPQFWPQGSSDADTTKLVLSIQPGSVRVRLHGQTKFQNTKVYDGAVIVTGKNQTTGKVLTTPLIKNNTITIRLQRIDAPELHYRPDARGSEGKLKGTGIVKDYRQHQAKTAVVKLLAYLQSFGKDPLPCTFTSELKASEGPGAAIDKYGRFVGDIILPDGTNLNLWLLSKGLAVIALYNSMLPNEIDESLTAWQQGRNSPSGITRFYSARFSAFDPTITFRKPVANAPIDVQTERTRRFMHPKFYRRQTTWWAMKQVGAYQGSYPDWLTDKVETCWYLPEFSALGKKAPLHPLYDRDYDGNGLAWNPEDFIFTESPSSIQRVGAGGEIVKLKDW
jgi:endonuclease YncB( thermonuclease family)